MAKDLNVNHVLNISTPVEETPQQIIYTLTAWGVKNFRWKRSQMSLVTDTAVLKLLDLYSSFSFTPQHSQYTVLASFFLIRSGSNPDIKVISLGTGTKCLPANRLSPKGEIVNDSHAEVLARRSAVLWFMEEIQRICSVGAYRSPWLDVCPNGRYALRDGVKLNLYISTVPCKFYAAHEYDVYLKHRVL